MNFISKKIFYLISVCLLFINSNAQTITENFTFTGNSQTWVVPNCVTSITVTVAGAAGGGTFGGDGATLNGTLNVTPGQQLEINIGGQGGTTNGGWNGGGNGATANNTGNGSFGGGGATDIRIAPYAISNRIIVAAGGGGQGGGSTDDNGGDGGCNNGQNGVGTFGFEGYGGTQNSGGNGGGGWNGAGLSGTNGILANGGNGANDNCYNLGPGGGGGGGYYGGGGGGADCWPNTPLGGGGGGGGSSLIPNGFNCTQGNSTGNGYVIIQYTLNISYGTDIQQHCNSYTWIDGNTYTTSNNTATHTLTNVFGCDSIITLDLTINNSTYSTDTQVHCDTYTWIDGNTYTSSNNTATYTLTNSLGCDSIVTLDLTINNTSFGTDTQIHCNSYTWIDGITYTSSNNIATYTLTNSLGCDSIVTLDLTIGYTNYGTDIQIQCDSYTWIDGNTYTTSNNTATFTLTNSSGCDSIITLDLTINYTTYGIDTQTHCDSYVWIDGNTYTTSNNTATHVLVNSLGCDSIVTLDLLINYSSSSTTYETECDNFTWNGNTYNNSGVYTYLTTNSNGCDSTAILNLTIYNTPQTNAGIDDTICGLSTILNANASIGIGTWICNDLNVTIHQPNNPNSLIDANSYNTYSIYWMENNNNCTNVDTVLFTFYEQPIANAGLDEVICGDNYILNAIPSAGTGEWTSINNLDFNNINDPNTSVISEIYNTLSMTWTETNNICIDSDNVNITFTAPPTSFGGDSIIICEGEDILIENSNISNYNNFYWQTNGNGEFSDINSLSPYYFYTQDEINNEELILSLVVENNPCPNAISDVNVTIRKKPSVIFTSENIEACDDGSIIEITAEFDGTLPFNGIYSNGTNEVVFNDLNEYSFTIETNESGIYTFTELEDLYCDNGNGVNSSIVTIYPMPESSFNFYPYPSTSIEDPEVSFFNTSIESDSWLWDFGDTTFSFEKDPIHFYEFAGNYTVTLKAYNEIGCVDSSYKDVIINPSFNFYMPTAFSPNNDNINDCFKPNGKGINEFQMNIYDRWGSTIYSTDNIEEGWCGNSNKSSIICPIGKYSFRIDIKDKLGKHHYFIGEVSLVK